MLKNGVDVQKRTEVIQQSFSTVTLLESLEYQSKQTTFKLGKLQNSFNTGDNTGFKPPDENKLCK